MADLNDVPGGAGGIATIVGGTAAAIIAAWRYLKTAGPNDANAAANSSAQIAALAQYKTMLEDEREARTEDAKRAAAENLALRAAWAEDVKTRNADYQAERQARLASDAKREEVMQELWTLRGKVNLLTDQLATLQSEVSRMKGAGNG